jgi:hypothetical protein
MQIDETNPSGTPVRNARPKRLGPLSQRRFPPAILPPGGPSFCISRTAPIPLETSPDFTNGYLTAIDTWPSSCCALVELAKEPLSNLPSAATGRRKKSELYSNGLLAGAGVRFMFPLT